MFNYVIGNPPYNKGFVKPHHDTYNKIGTVKLAYYAFIIKSIEMLDIDGEMLFIIPSTFLTSSTGIELRKFIMENGFIKFIKILENNPFSGYTISGSVIIFQFKKSDKQKTIFERCLNGTKYSYEKYVNDIIPLYINDLSASILEKVIKKTEQYPTIFIRNKPRNVFLESDSKNRYKTLIRFNKGKNLIYRYVSENIDIKSNKIVFSLMMNMNTLYKDKQIFSMILKNADVDRGLVYIKCKNNKIVQQYLKSKILYVCILQMLDGAHLTKYNLGKIVPDIDNLNFENYFQLSTDEIEFLKII